MDLSFLKVLLPMLFEGLKLTLLIAIVGIAIGTIIGSLCGYALQASNKLAKAVYMDHAGDTTYGAGSVWLLCHSETDGSGSEKYNCRYYGNCTEFRSFYF